MLVLLLHSLYPPPPPHTLNTVLAEAVAEESGALDRLASSKLGAGVLLLDVLTGAEATSRSLDR